MRHVRSRARSWALSLLYGWELAGTETPAVFASAALEHRKMAPRYRPYVDRLLETVGEHLEEIDATITRHASNWRLDRLDAIDRNILRIGIAELRWLADVPPKVAIHEGLKLAQKYGGEDSPAFVNGILDAAFKEARPEADAEDGPEG